MAARKKREPKPSSIENLNEQITRVELEVQLAQLKSAKALLSEAEVVIDSEREGWEMISSAGRLAGTKNLFGEGVVTDLSSLRKASYKAWRLDPHGRGVLRNVLKYTAGRGLSLDFEDKQRGQWSDKTKTHLQATQDSSDPLLTRLVWKDFAKRNKWSLRAKELVRRTVRDGDMFLRRFVTQGKVSVRFIEPDYVKTPPGTEKGQVSSDDVLKLSGVLSDSDVGAATVIRDGVEALARDVETPIAYYVARGEGTFRQDFDRISASDVCHLKCGADENDARGIPFLEPVLKKLSQYDTWEEYRIILNKVRTAIALVRKVDGSSSQASTLIAGRLPAATSPSGRDPQTTSGRREAAFRPGTLLTPSAGITYDFISPRLDARDAGEDGRRILLSVASGAGQPEMLVTSDYSNANFSSTSVAAQLVQREWEDWQDFFEPAFVQVYEWVIEAAIEGLGLSEETDRNVTVQWPLFLRQDESKATDRRSKLQGAGILSKRTWAAEEGYIYDDELENIEQDDDQPPVPSSGTGNPVGRPTTDPNRTPRTDQEPRARTT